MSAAGGAIGTAIDAHNQAIGAAGAHATSVDGVARAYGGAGAAANSAASSFTAANAAAGGGGAKTSAEQYKEGFDKSKKEAEGGSKKMGSMDVVPNTDDVGELEDWLAGYESMYKVDFAKDSYGWGAAANSWVMGEYNATLKIAKAKAASKKKREDQEKAEAKKAENTTAPASLPTAAPAGASSGTSSSTGATYVSHITLPSGRKETMRFADAQSQSAGERLLRELAAGKGVAQ